MIPPVIVVTDPYGVPGSVHYRIVIDLLIAATVRVYPFAGAERTWVVTGLWVAPGQRRRGLARRIMAAVCAAADSQRVTLRLTPEPDVDANITLVALRNFYASLGFAGPDGMLRLPLENP